MADVLCIGDLLIDFVPTVTGTGLADAPAFEKAPGGAAANVAVGLARLGVPSAFAGKVGDDPFGHFLADVLRSHGVDVGPLRFDSRARTALAFVSLRADGEREFLFYRHPSADMLFTAADIAEAAIAGAKALHFDSISLASENPRDACMFAADVALAAGKLVSYDVNLRLPLWKDAEAAKAGILAGLAKAQVVKLSDDELEFLTGSREPAAVRRLWHDRLRVVTLTRGAAGSVWMTPDAQGEVPSFRITAVDTTGAGDAFMAGLIAGLISTSGGTPDVASGRRPDLDRICLVANAMGAVTASARGAIPSLPDRAAVRAFLTKQGRAADLRAVWPEDSS
jgi:fructokinase